MKTYSNKFETAPITKSIKEGDALRVKILIGEKGYVFMKVIKQTERGDFLCHGTSKGKFCQMYILNSGANDRAISMSNMEVNLLKRN